MRLFDRDSVIQDYGEPLLNMVCALGAVHLVGDYSASLGPLTFSQKLPGQLWADKARKEVMDEIDSPTVPHLMVSGTVSFFNACDVS